MKKYAWMLIACVMMIGVVSGCNRTTSVGAANKAFESADEESKTLWNNAIAASKTNDYAGSITILNTLRAKPSLTPVQYKAAEDVLTSIQQKMMEAVNRGDPEAQKAMDELNEVNRQMRGR